LSIAAEPLNRFQPFFLFFKVYAVRNIQEQLCCFFCCEQFIPNYYKIVRSGGSDAEAKETFAKALQRLESELKARGKFFGGNFFFLN
jgi:hypothetical protein